MTKREFTVGHLSSVRSGARGIGFTRLQGRPSAQWSHLLGPLILPSCSAREV
jgi:hypothetical protein